MSWSPVSDQFVDAKREDIKHFLASSTLSKLPEVIVVPVPAFDSLRGLEIPETCKAPPSCQDSMKEVQPMFHFSRAHCTLQAPQPQASRLPRPLLPTASFEEDRTAEEVPTKHRMPFSHPLSPGTVGFRSLQAHRNLARVGSAARRKHSPNVSFDLRSEKIPCVPEVPAAFRWDSGFLTPELEGLSVGPKRKKSLRQLKSATVSSPIPLRPLSSPTLPPRAFLGYAERCQNENLERSRSTRQRGSDTDSEIAEEQEPLSVHELF